MKTKKELKADYKQLKPESGVFQVMNDSTGKLLIEGASNMSSKWNRHRTELRFGSHRNKTLQKDWNTYGESAFAYSVLSALKIDDSADVNIKDEVQLLYEMVIEEKNIQKDQLY